MSANPRVFDAFASASRYVTAPYARGAATLELSLGPSVAGVANFLGYSFSAFQSRFEVQTSALEASYVITLSAPLGDGPVTLDIDYNNDSGAATAQLLIPAGTLPGTSFVVPLPAHGGLAFLETLHEHPSPDPGSPSGPDKWSVTALLGNTGCLLSLLTGEQQVLGATARDVLSQRHLLTARGESLDRIGEALDVPRFLPAPYRLDLDTATIALYHFDDVIAPLLDATGNHPGASHGAKRGVPGRIGGAVQITSQGGLTVPDDSAFIIAPNTSFTIEMFAQVQPVADATSFLAVKRSSAKSSLGSGWALTLEGVAAGSARLHFILTDRTGNVVEAVSPQFAVGGWIHVAGVLDAAQKTVSVFVNGVSVASTKFQSLAEIQNCGDIGLGADRLGNALMQGFLDEVRFSNTARSNFSAVIAGTPYAIDAASVALYHMDENDDWIDEVSGRHYAINHGATRGVPARFDSGVSFTGDPLPEPRCASEIEFQRLLNAGLWDRTLGGAKVIAGPYTRFGYRQGAISLPGLTGVAQPVLVNDANTIDASVRGRITTACYGFTPTDLNQTIATFQQNGRSVQEAIDYFGDWNGEPSSFFVQQYKAHGITVAHESCLPPPGSPAWIQVPASPDLAIDQASSFTVEAIIRPDSTANDYPRVIAASRYSGLRDGEANANEAGWALSLCDCDCIPDNLRWTVGDAAGNLVVTTAASSLADGSFHHVAGVLDRDAGTALLFVDGVEVGKQAIGALGAAAAATDIFIGNDPLLDAPYGGLVDELRLSRAARRTFHPVLGESDQRYRQRLAIFWPYRLPSFVTLERGVRALSLVVTATADDVATEATNLLLGDLPPSDQGQLNVLETDSSRFCATRKFQVLPAKLLPGQSIAKDGTTPANETAATGSFTFHQDALIRHDDQPGLSFASEGSRWMILRAAQGLDALVADLQKVSAQTVIVVQSAWDPSAGGLQAQGRSLNIGLSNPGPGIDLGMVAALAHEFGVEYVAFDGSAGFVRLSFASGADLDLTGPAVVAPGVAVPITIARPRIQNPGSIVFRILRCGTGDGTLTGLQANATTCLFTGTALGNVTITAQCELSDGSFLYGAHEISIAPDSLDACAVISNTGIQDISETQASGQADPDFQQAYLVRSTAPSVDFASEAARHMQLPLETALRNLAALASAEPGSPRITVLATYDPASANLQAVGRGLVVGPSAANLTASRLAALAYRSGFSYIQRRRYPPSVYASVAPGPRFQIVRSPIQRLWPNARVSGLGEFMAEEFAAAGPPDPNFTVAMLQPYAGAGVTFATGVSNQVQATLAAALNSLVTALQGDGFAGPLQVIAGFSPAAKDLTSVGRALLIRHPVVTADRLSGYALASGFAFVQHRPAAPGGAAVYAAAYPSGGAPPSVFTDDDVVLNMLAELSIRPELPIVGSLDWTIVPCCPGKASLSTAPPDATTASIFAHKVLQGTASGVITVVASFSLADAAEPYQFIVESGLKDGLRPKLTKDQYDDLLNFVDAYHPVGVQASTWGIRQFVQGFPRPPRWDQLPTSATFPRYRSGR
jgi:hypothetical protein